MPMFPIVRSGTLLSILCLISCGGGGGGNPSSTSGEFSLGVSDAAVDSAEQVLVQFTGVTVKPREGSAIDLNLAGDSQTCQDLLDGNPPVQTPEGTSTVRCIDLLTLQGTESAALVDGVILEAGEYNWIRLDVDADRGVMDSIIVLDDGSRESLYVPSGSESGLKLNSSFTILAGGNHDFVIDFDLRKSVNNPQGFADYRLKPSLRLTDRAASGNVTGSVSASLLSADNCTQDAYAVYVYEGGAEAIVGEEGSPDAPLTSAAVALSGSEWRYTAGYLAPGEYALAFTCEAANDTEDPEDGIEFVSSSDSPTTVVSGQDSVVNFSPTANE